MIHLTLIVKAAAALATVKPSRKKYSFAELRSIAKPAAGIQYKNNYSLTHLAGRMPF